MTISILMEDSRFLATKIITKVSEKNINEEINEEILFKKIEANFIIDS